jgi:hypothetical protein
MTEQEWLTCADPHPMLEFLRGKASDRKLRFFAVACSRRVWSMIDPLGQAAVDVAENYADGLAGPDEMRAARLACQEAGDQASWSLPPRSPKLLLETLPAVPRQESPVIRCSAPRSANFLRRRAWCGTSSVIPSNPLPSIPLGLRPPWSNWPRPYTTTEPSTGCQNWPKPWRKLDATTMKFSAIAGGRGHTFEGAGRWT